MDRNYRHDDDHHRETRDPYYKEPTSSRRHRSRERERVYDNREIEPRSSARNGRDFSENSRKDKIDSHSYREDSYRSRRSSLNGKGSSRDRHRSSREPYSSRHSNKPIDPYVDSKHLLTYNEPPIATNCSCEIIVKNLPSYVDETALRLFITQQGYTAENVRLEKVFEDVGYPVVYAHVTFLNPMVAQSWFSANQGALKFVDGFVSLMEFDNSQLMLLPSNPDFLFPSASTQPLIHQPPYDINHYILEWICTKCTTENSGQRPSCFKCGISKEFSQELEAKGYGLAGTTPCKTLLVREIPENIDRRDIIVFLEQYRAPMAECIHMADTKKFCLIEMKTFEDAIYIIEMFERIPPHINGQLVNVTYSKVPLDVIFVHENMKKIQNEEYAKHRDESSDKISRIIELDKANLQKSSISYRDKRHRKTDIDKIKEDIRRRMADRKKRELEKKMHEIQNKEALLNEKEADILAKGAKLLKASKPSHKEASKLKISVTNKSVARNFLKDVGVQTNNAKERPNCLNCLGSRTKYEHMLKDDAREYQPPKLETFEYDSCGYYFDKSTGFYFDPNSEHFYDPMRKQWLFWYSKYERYFPCDGGNFRSKKLIQDSEREKLIGPLALALRTNVNVLSINEDKALQLSNETLQICVAQNQLLQAILKNKISSKEAEKDLEYINELTKERLELLAQEAKSHIAFSLPTFQYESLIDKDKSKNTNKARKTELDKKTEMGELEGISDNEVDESSKKKARNFLFPEPLNITGSDPLSMQLKTLVPDGNIQEWHLILCTKCGHVGHSVDICQNEKVDKEIVQKMLILIQLYRLSHPINSNSKWGIIDFSQGQSTSEVEDNKQI